MKKPGLTALTDDRPYGAPYCCFTYSASAVEAEIDVLTGELDILDDVGRALNPAAVIGQIEGGFVQGVGALTTEEVVYQQAGTAIGRLNTANTWTYKLPTHTSIPLDLRVRLYAPTDRTAPPDPRLPRQARPTGQSGGLLAIPVFFAIKHAILAVRHDQGLHEWLELDPPATVQQIQTACRVDLHSLIP